jgi:hypothetical protein
MLKRTLSSMLLVPIFCLFLLVGGSYAWGGKDKTPKPAKPAPKAAYVISQADTQQPTKSPAPEKKAKSAKPAKKSKKGKSKKEVK